MLQDSVTMHKYRNRRHAINLFALLAIFFFVVIIFKSHIIQYSQKVICTQEDTIAEKCKDCFVVLYCLLLTNSIRILIWTAVDGPDQSTLPTNATVSSNNEAIAYHPSFTHVSAAEYEFETTIRSCLGTFCFDEPVKRRSAQNPKETFTRIGILFPYSSNPDSSKEINLLLKLIETSGNIRLYKIAFIFLKIINLKYFYKRACFKMLQERKVRWTPKS